MRTVSLEMAKKLKEAGLQHQITYGDWHLAWLPEKNTYTKPVLYDYTATGPFEEDIWLPTLSDLLEWLEGRGYEWTLELVNGKCKYSMIIANPNWWRGSLSIEEILKLEDKMPYNFPADTPEDTAAKAVLWVLEREGKDE